MVDGFLGQMGQESSGQLNSSSDHDGSGEGEPGSPPGGTASTSSNQPRRFPLAAQPEIMRAAEKDDQYASFVYDACRDAVRHLFGPFSFPHPLSPLQFPNCSYLLTSICSGFCPGTDFGLCIFCSSRVASRGIALSELQSDDDYGEMAPGGSNRVQTSAMMLPVAREFLQLILRTNLMFFYFEGLYYHISKRAAGIRYVFIGKPSNQRPRPRSSHIQRGGKFGIHGDWHGNFIVRCTINVRGNKQWGQQMYALPE
ncbi:unnamed protein product [Linum tenue]|uniref:RING-type E3 ubiquitin transferase n=1 Tax=Linum tenue TaxID=586396 RepID=A0AAV0MNL7_9ROSI|nr:unnamed protein product [Linum tenue]